MKGSKPIRRVACIHPQGFDETGFGEGAGIGGDSRRARRTNVKRQHVVRIAIPVTILRVLLLLLHHHGSCAA